MNENIKQMLEGVDPDVLMAGKTMSICAAYISEALIAASISELRVILLNRCNGLAALALLNRWSHIRDMTEHNTREENEKIEKNIEEALEWGVKMGAFERSIVPGKYSPTNHGWQIGKLYSDTILKELSVAGSNNS